MDLSVATRRGFLAVGSAGFVFGGWPGFRGDGSSVASERKLPLTWKEPAWRLPLPGYGQSSPAVWGDRVFLTAVEGAEKERLHAICVDARKGTLLWDQGMAATQRWKDSNMVTKGSPSPAADGKLAYFFFDSGDLAAFDHSGKLRWRRKLTEEFGPFAGNHGVGNSTRLAGRTLLQLVTHGGQSYLLAVEAATGKTLWKTDVAAGASWSTPVVAGGLVLANASGKVFAWRLADGALAWEMDGHKGNVIPSVTVAGGVMVIGASDKGASAVYRLGAGKPELLWRPANATANFCSPLVHGGQVLFVNKVGVLYALDLATGKELWTDRVGGEVWSSPMGAGDRIYCFTVEGQCTVYRAGAAQPEVLGRSAMEVNGRVYAVVPLESGLVLRAGRELVGLRS